MHCRVESHQERWRELHRDNLERVVDQTESHLVEQMESHLVDQTESHLVRRYRSPKKFGPHGWLIELLELPLQSSRHREVLRNFDLKMLDHPPRMVRGGVRVRHPDLDDICTLITQVGRIRR